MAKSERPIVNNEYIQNMNKKTILLAAVMLVTSVVGVLGMNSNTQVKKARVDIFQYRPGGSGPCTDCHQNPVYEEECDVENEGDVCECIVNNTPVPAYSGEDGCIQLKRPIQ